MNSARSSGLFIWHICANCQWSDWRFCVVDSLPPNRYTSAHCPACTERQKSRICSSFVVDLEARVLFNTSVYRGECLINLRTTEVIVRTYEVWLFNTSVYRGECLINLKTTEVIVRTYEVWSERSVCTVAGFLLLFLTGGEDMFWVGRL